MATAAPPAPAGENPKDPAARPLAKPPVAKAPAGKVPHAPALETLLPQQGDVPADEQQEEQPHHPAGFLNEPWVQNILPLASSFVFHVVLVVVGLLLIQKIPQLVNPNKEQTIIPESKSMEKTAIPGGIPHPGLNSDPTRDAAQDAIKNSKEDGFTDSVNNNLNALQGGQGDTEVGQFEGASTSGGKGNTGFAGASGGGTAPFGAPGGGAGGLLPKSNFMGTGGNADKVVFLCDKSGSMLSVFGSLKQKLKESINQLTVEDGQQFNIIFFSDEGADMLFKEGMQIASADNKKRAMDYIDNEVAAGGTLPLPAIKEAMHEKPQLLYVLTDGFDQIASFDEVIKAFRDGNTDGKMHINCIFLQADEDPKLEETLRKITDQNNGEFRKVLKADM